MSINASINAISSFITIKDSVQEYTNTYMTRSLGYNNYYNGWSAMDRLKDY